MGDGGFWGRNFIDLGLPCPTPPLREAHPKGEGKDFHPMIRFRNPISIRTGVRVGRQFAPIRATR